MKFPLPVLMIFILLISGCDRQINLNSSAAELKESESDTEARLIAVGDLLMHMSVIRSGYNPKKKVYNFKNIFKQVKPIISTGDWAIANLETTVAGSKLGYSGYPLFNAPAQIVDAAKWAGFNVLTTANNHALDKGEKGLINTIKNIRTRGIVPVGTATSPQEASKILIIKKKNISMAIMAYTYGTNGIPIPRGKNYLVSLIDEDKILKDIARARKQGADVVTICLHFGTEYQRLPNAQQKRLVRRLIRGGADIILGSHPHVVQPYQIFKVRGKDKKIRTRVAIYSMGNFIGNQVGKYRNLGVIFSVKLRRRFPEGNVEITRVEAIPTWIYKYKRNNQLKFRVLPIEAVVSNPNDTFLPEPMYRVLNNYFLDINSHLKSLNNKK
ncbi:MAG: CapA family protein [Fischerella sp.]|nr:CapA family protein [Fischerella sp.]